MVFRRSWKRKQRPDQVAQQHFVAIPVGDARSERRVVAAQAADPASDLLVESALQRQHVERGEQLLRVLRLLRGKSLQRAFHRGRRRRRAALRRQPAGAPRSSSPAPRGPPPPAPPARRAPRGPRRASPHSRARSSRRSGRATLALSPGFCREADPPAAPRAVRLQRERGAARLSARRPVPVAAGACARGNPGRRSRAAGRGAAPASVAQGVPPLRGRRLRHGVLHRSSPVPRLSCTRRWRRT